MTEPTLILYSALTGVNGIQWAAVHMPTWAHLLVTIVTGAGTAYLNRKQVTPNAKQTPQPETDLV